MEFVWNLTIQGKKRKMKKRDLNLEGFSVQGSIRDCFALRKLVPDYRPIKRKPDIEISTH